MKATGIVRKIDRLGRIVIPKDIKIDMGYEKNVALEFFIDQDKLVLQKYYPACTFCGEKEKNENDRYEFSGKTVCRSCVQELSS